jgi:hypothetical protein
VQSLHRALVVLGLVHASACAGGLELTPIQHAAEKPSNVAVYFRVTTSDGDPVAGLEASAFRIHEDDKLVSEYESKQTILNPEVAASHYTLLLIDMSGSVAESDDRPLIGEAAQKFSTLVETNNKVAVYAFDGSEELHLVSKFSSGDAAGARAAALGSFKPKDPSTNLHGAVIKAIEELDKALEDAENPLRFGTLVVFTDGTDRAARVTSEEMQEAIDSSAYEVFAIGLGAEISEEDLARVGKDGVAMASDSEGVAEAFEAVAERIQGMTKAYYLLSYCSPARAQKHEVRIDAKRTVDDDEQTGSLTTEFDAEGFEPGCDPNRKPSFDVTKGDAIREQQLEEGEARGWSFKKRETSASAEASAGGADEK